MSDLRKGNADSSPKSVRVWMKAEAGGRTFTAEGFGSDFRAASQCAAEQIDERISADVTSKPVT